MAIPPGTRLGSYEIHTYDSAGGVGEVYRPADTMLGRAAVVKILPLEMARDPGHLAAPRIEKD